VRILVTYHVSCGLGLMRLEIWGIWWGLRFRWGWGLAGAQAGERVRQYDTATAHFRVYAHAYADDEIRH
jgi:hypothetical protein